MVADNQFVLWKICLPFKRRHRDNILKGKDSKLRKENVFLFTTSFFNLNPYYKQLLLKSRHVSVV